MLGEKIKELRERENYSQKELGLKLGISPSTIGMYEQNRRSPGKDMLLKIAKVFNVSVDYLLSSDTYNTTSTKENHNYNRPYKNGNGTFDDIYNSLLKGFTI